MKGFSFIETLVVLGIFSLIAVVVGQATISSFRASRKTEAAVETRENLEYALAVMERELRNAQSISTCNQDMTSIRYVDSQSISNTFTCISNSTGQFVRLNTQRITSTDVVVSTCRFSCQPGPANVPEFVEIYLSGSSVEGSGVTDSTIDLQTRVLLRSY